jgi:hypothetical protein
MRGVQINSLKALTSTGMGRSSSVPLTYTVPSPVDGIVVVLQAVPTSIRVNDCRVDPSRAGSNIGPHLARFLPWNGGRAATHTKCQFLPPCEGCALRGDPWPSRLIKHVRSSNFEYVDLDVASFTALQLDEFGYGLDSV